MPESWKDTQRNSVYKWEDGWKPWRHDGLTLRQCQKWADWACNKYRVSRVVVKKNKGKKWSAYNAGYVFLGKTHRNFGTMMHEVAHHIVEKRLLKGRKMIEAHGPEWLGIFLWLVVESKWAPATAVYGSAQAAGLEFIRRSSPKHIAKKR
jgi:hypothetical protein